MNENLTALLANLKAAYSEFAAGRYLRGLSAAGLATHYGAELAIVFVPGPLMKVTDAAAVHELLACSGCNDQMLDEHEAELKKLAAACETESKKMMAAGDPVALGIMDIMPYIKIALEAIRLIREWRKQNPTPPKDGGLKVATSASAPLPVAPPADPVKAASPVVNPLSPPASTPPASPSVG